MRSVRDFDRRLTAATRKLPGWAGKIMESISFLGEPVLVVAIGFIGFLSATVRHQPDVQKAFFYAAVAFILSTLLKLILRRARPHNLDIRTFGVRSYSFPSGHAFGTVIFYGLYSYLDLKYLAHPWNVVISVILWLMIGLIGIARVYLKAHYPSDVLGGWLLGLVLLYVVINLAF